MTSRMVGSVLTLVILLSSVVGGAAQTYTQMQWGMNKGVTPYAFGANINGTWRDLGTVSAAGAWGLTLSGASTFNSAVTFNSPLPSGIALNTTLNDTSAVIGNAASFYYPSYFGNPGTGRVHRLNRLFVGEASLTSGGIDAAGQMNPRSWLFQYFKNEVPIAQFASGSTTGQLGIIGYSRTSDFKTWAGGTSGGSQGITGFGLNDDTTVGTVPIACGVCGVTVHAPGVMSGVSVNQMDIVNLNVDVATDPYYGIIGGTTWPLLLTGGVMPEQSANIKNVTALLGLGKGDPANPNGVALAGIIIMSDALKSSVGTGGNGVAMDMARGQSLRWVNSGHTADAEIFGNADGLILRNAALTADNGVRALTYTSTSTVPTISSCGTSPTSDADSNNTSGKITLGTGTFASCTVTYANAYPSKSFCSISKASSTAVDAYVTTTSSALVINAVAGNLAASSEYSYVCAGK